MNIKTVYPDSTLLPSFFFFYLLLVPRFLFLSLSPSLSLSITLVHLETDGHLRTRTSKIFLRARRLDEQAIPLRGIILTRHASTRQCVRPEFRSLCQPATPLPPQVPLTALYCPVGRRAVFSRLNCGKCCRSSVAIDR